jgi:hypothetical protein
VKNRSLDWILLGGSLIPAKVLQILVEQIRCWLVYSQKRLNIYLCMATICSPLASRNVMKFQVLSQSEVVLDYFHWVAQTSAYMMVLWEILPATIQVIRCCQSSGWAQLIPIEVSRSQPLPNACAPRLQGAESKVYDNFVSEIFWIHFSHLIPGCRRNPEDWYKKPGQPHEIFLLVR